MKRFWIICAVIACMFAFSACGNEQSGKEEDGDSKLVGISMHNDEDTSWYRGGEDLKNELAALGYRVDLEHTENDVTRQIAQIEDMIRAEADAIIVSPTEPDGLGSILADARAAGIKIISYDKLIMDTENVDYYLTFGFEEAGRLQAEYIINELGLDEGKTASVEFVLGSSADLATKSFYNGVMDNLYGYINSGVLIVPSGRTTFEQVTLDEDSDILAKDRIGTLINMGLTSDAIICQTDRIARGVSGAYSAIGVQSYDFPIITGQNAEASAINLISQGKQKMSVFKDIRILSSDTAKAIDTILRGEEPAAKVKVSNGKIDVPTWTCESSVVESYNYKDKLIDSGYYTAEEVGSAE